MTFPDVITDDRYKKKIYSSINLTSYNKKAIVLDTWSKLKDNEINERTFEDDLNELLMEEHKKKLHNNEQFKKNINDDIDTDDTDDSNDSYKCLIQKIMKNKCN